MEAGVSDCTAQLGIPAYELLRFLTGKPVYRLMACLRQSMADHVLDDNASIVMELENGCFAVLSLSRIALLHENHLSFEIEGSKGTIAWTNEKPSV